ncbi:hypothetical protein FRC00_002772 [Tulasnella sp. 408]|nr:hypothetical protein FRC00_002772 [Tulasnella sp. 408]
MTDNTNPDSLPPYHAELRDLHERIQKERNPTDDHITDPNPDSLFNQGIQEAVGSAMHGYEQIYKELTAAALLAPDASFFDNPDEPGAQIMALRFDPHLEVIPSTEMDEEVEKSSYFSEPMFESESFCIWKMAWAKRCYVAAKAPKPMPKDVLTPLLNRNTAVWRSMKHPNILPLLGVCRFDFIGEVDSRIHFISPWMKNGNVRFYLSSNPGADRVQLIHDVALGLQYLHGIGVVHRNLKGSNVLVNLDGTAVISGFISKVMIFAGRLPTTNTSGEKKGTSGLGQ